MDRENAIYFLAEREDDLTNQMLYEWQVNKNIKNSIQAWKVIPAHLLIREWKYNQKTSMVHEKLIEKFQDIVIENYLKIDINTILFGHTQASPFGFAESHISEDMTSEQFEDFLDGYEWFACDKRGNWRISDFGLDKIGKLCIDLLEEEDYNKKLMYIDLILNVAHQRSDLASWFVENGSYTLSCMFEM